MSSQDIKLNKKYYTRSNSGIIRENIPEARKNKFPKTYKNLPVTLLGKLARDYKYEDERLGETLLLDALTRCFDTSFTIGLIAVVIDPVYDKARRFYLKYGFIHLPDSKKMFLSMKTTGKLFIEITSAF